MVLPADGALLKGVGRRVLQNTMVSVCIYGEYVKAFV
jgi:hypothetical protein